MNKFEDCYMCRWRKNRRYCRECDFGEFFEDKSIEQELRFDDDEDNYRRAQNSLTTDDDEPYHNPDDFLDNLDDEMEIDDE